MNIIKSFLFSQCKCNTDIGLLIFRWTLGLVLLYGHGFGKLSVVFSGQEIQFMDPIGIGANLSFYMATFAEGICAILLILGLFSRFASLVLTVNFIVIFIFHAFIVKDGFEVLELRYLYLLPFIALTFTGAGNLSLDHLFFKEK
ncbi:MAG: DoxX family protein [Chitinophagales bacterium]|nr:DoxX family protein [Chitinophagales bacterium]MCZ2393146.1 DoxX family protein [Chitinophagales bacterium]